jgi:hypothetical protein
MKRRRAHKDDDYVIPRETPEERALLESGEHLRVPNLIREATDVRPDGRLKHSSSVVGVAGWDRVTAAAPLLAPTVSADEDGPVFDVLELGGGRALRDSVSLNYL